MTIFFNILYIWKYQQLSIIWKNHNYYSYHYHVVFRKKGRKHLSLSLYIYFKNSSLNKPLLIIRTSINSVNWLSVQWNNVAESALHRKKKNRTFFDSIFKHSQILKFEKMAVGHLPIRQYANNIRPKEFRPTIFQRFDEMANLFIGQMLCPRQKPNVWWVADFQLCFYNSKSFWSKFTDDQPTGTKKMENKKLANTHRHT